MYAKFTFKKNIKGQSSANCILGRSILPTIGPKTVTRSPESHRTTHLIHECKLWPPAPVDQMTYHPLWLLSNPCMVIA